MMELEIGSPSGAARIEQEQAGLTSDLINGIVLELGVPSIRGRIDYLGGTVVSVPLGGILEQKPLITQGALALIDIRHCDINENEVRSLTLAVRLGASDTWLKSAIVVGEDPDDNWLEGDDEDLSIIHLKPEEQWPLAILVANSPGFRELKNKRQRRDLTQSVLEDSDCPEAAMWHVEEIAELAESYYNLGMIPLQAQRLKAQGKTTAEISKVIGITAQRVERALDAKIPDYIADMIALADQESTGAQ